MPALKRLRLSTPAPACIGPQAQRCHDVVAHARRRSRGQREEGHTCERLSQLAQAPVLQPEVMAPCTCFGISNSSTLLHGQRREQHALAENRQ